MAPTSSISRSMSYTVQCLVCSNEMQVNSNSTKKVCSPKCRIDLNSKEVNDCLIWTGSRDRKGYGFVILNGKQIFAHRLSYEAHNGNIPIGMLIRHSCDNPSCVKPSHLSIGTHKDNSDDCIARGRNAIGERNGCSVLKENDIRFIRNSNLTNVQLADKFSVNVSTIKNVKSRKTWKHIG